MTDEYDKMQMRSRITLWNVNERNGKKSNFMISHPDFFNDEQVQECMHFEKAYRLINLGWAVFPAEDQNTRRKSRTLKIPTIKRPLGNPQLFEVEKCP